jgi:hypothetical protein
LFRHLLLQIGGANIANTLPLLSLPCGAARFTTFAPRAALHLVLAQHATLRSSRLVDQTERSDRVALLDELGHAGVDLAAGEVVDLQALHDLVRAAGGGARE